MTTTLDASAFGADEILNYHNDVSYGHSGSPIFDDNNAVLGIVTHQTPCSGPCPCTDPAQGPRLRQSMFDDICSWIADPKLSKRLRPASRMSSVGLVKLLPAVVAARLLACDGESDVATGGTNPGTSSSVSAASSGGGGADPVVPPECDLSISPYIQPGCRDAIRERCLQHASQETCEAAPSVNFSGYKVLCSWATVVHFSDPSNCTVDSISARCEATQPEDFVVYKDPCDVRVSDMFSDWYAITSTNEMLKTRYGGPIAPEEPGHHIGCGSVSAPQPICSCTDAACDSLP